MLIELRSNTLGDVYWVNPDQIVTIMFRPNLPYAMVGVPGSSFAIVREDAEKLLNHINGAAAQSPAADVPAGKMRHITSVRMFVSRSGNESWEGIADDAVVYFRQAQKEMLTEAGLWHQLNRMTIGDTWKADITLYTVPDGDLHKIVRIDPMGSVFPPDTWYPDAPDQPSVSEAIEAVQAMTNAQVTGVSVLDGVMTIYTAPETDDLPDDDPFYSVIRSGNYVVLDTETTGLDERAEICQIAIIDSAGKVLLDTLVKPQNPIPSQATRVHGITNAMVKDSPNFINVAQAVWDACQGKTVIVYNADYDFRLLAQSEYACEPIAVSDWHTLKRECAMLKFAKLYGEWSDYRGDWKWQTLTTAARHYMLPVQGAHSALGDCQMTLALVKAMLAAEDTRHDAN